MVRIYQANDTDMDAVLKMKTPTKPPTNIGTEIWVKYASCLQDKIDLQHRLLSEMKATEG